MNIAETSMTNPGFLYAMALGPCKHKSYNSKTGMESLLVVPVAQARVIQCAERDRRMQPGKCFLFHTKQLFRTEKEHDTVPETLRTNVAKVILMLISLGIDDSFEFAFVDEASLDMPSRSSSCTRSGLSTTEAANETRPTDGSVTVRFHDGQGIHRKRDVPGP